MPSKSAKFRRPEPREKAPARRVAIVAFPGVTLLDISGPAQVFAELQAIDLPGAGYSLSYLSTSGGLVPTDVGMMVDTAPISSIRPNQLDTLVIPGGPGIWALRQDAVLMKWIMEVLPKARRVASVCLGAFGWPGSARWMASAPRRIGATVRGWRTVFQRSASSRMRSSSRTGGSGHRPASAPASTLRSP
jgi:putative intracellular protease/amidase